MDLSALKKRFYVIDRGTMINTLTHTDAFSIGTGILSEGFAGPELTIRPIQRKGTPLSDEMSMLLGMIRDELNH